MEDIILYLKNNNKSISTMESATGGYIASSITNISGSSLVFNFGAVTYSNLYKIKFGVSEDIINKYTVYSIECAKEMSKCIASYTNSNYGVGVTGKINDKDPNNNFGLDDIVFLSIYDMDNNKYYTKKIKVLNDLRIVNKELICKEFINLFKSIIKE